VSAAANEVAIIGNADSLAARSAAVIDAPLQGWAIGGTWSAAVIYTPLQGWAIGDQILYTIVENCRRLGINPKEYLTDVLTRLPAMKASEAASLIPAVWLKARRGKPVRMVA